MDVSFSTVVEGTRQYFLGLPKASPSQSSAPRDDSVAAGQPFWSEATPPAAPAPALAQSGAPAMPDSRPPSVAAAHPPVSALDEPLEPEPHIIHKATVMREALEKREREGERAAPEPPLSPPTHLIRKPEPPPPPQHQHPPQHPHQHTHPHIARLSAHPHQHLAPQQTYARSSAPAHQARAASSPKPSTQQHRYPPLNDRVPPILHPTHAAAPAPPPPPTSRATQPQRLPADSVSGHAYGATPPPPPPPSGRHNQPAPGYERHRPAATAAPRKYEAYTNSTYSGFAAARSQRLATSVRPMRQYADDRLHVAPATSHARVDGAIAHHYPPRPPDGARAPTQPQPDASRNSARGDYRYAVTSTQNYSLPPQSSYAQPTASAYHAPPQTKPAYDTSPPRVASAAGKSGFASHQPRPTVSVTSLVDQMNQTKQKRESPLDLSVKTVKNSADSTAQDDDVSTEARDRLEPHSTTTLAAGRLRAPAASSAPLYAARTSHKVDFSPNFHSQYAEKTAHDRRYVAEPSRAHAPSRPATTPSNRINGSYENTVRTHAPRAVGETYIVDNRYQPGHPRYTTAAGERIDRPLPRIDLTRSLGKEQYRDARPPAVATAPERYTADDSRKRLGGSALSNIPPKLVRYETWSDDSRIERSRLSHAAQEQHKLMSQPVYSYSSHKQFEVYQNEQRRAAAYHYRHPSDPTRLLHYERKPSAERYPTDARHIIQKAGSHRSPDRVGVPADKRVLSILRNSLETRGAPEPRRVTELIVIDDDTPEETAAAAAAAARRTAAEVPRLSPSRASLKLHMPRAVDSIRYDSDSSQKSSSFEEFMAKQKKIDLQLSPDKNRSPDGDVASRIRTKAELKGFTLPVTPAVAFVPFAPPDECMTTMEERLSSEVRSRPTSQKAHLFRQLYEQNEAERQVRLESVIKQEMVTPESELPPNLVKLEPMNIEEIEKDAIEPAAEDEPPPSQPEDLDWAAACDSFMEQLKSGCAKKKPRQRRIDSNISEKAGDAVYKEIKKVDLLENSSTISIDPTISEETIIKSIKIELDSPETSEKDCSIEDADKEKEVTQKKEKYEEIAVAEDETKGKQSNNKEKNVSLKSDPSENVDLNTKLENENEKELHELGKKLKSIDRKISSRTKEVTESRRKCLGTLAPAEDWLVRSEKKAIIVEKKKEKDERREERGSKKKHETVVKTEPADDVESTPTREQLQQIEKSVTVNVIDIIKSDRRSLLLDHIKKEAHEESTDDDEPLINSKLLKDKQRTPHATSAPVDPKTLVVKLECCHTMPDLKNPKISAPKDTESKTKLKQKCKPKSKISGSGDVAKADRKRSESSAESEGDEPGVSSRLRVRKLLCEDNKTKSLVKNGTGIGRGSAGREARSVTPRKPGFGDGSDFHPGWEEEVYKYKRSLRMPSRLIRVPQSPWLPTRLSSSLPDLDPPPVSPAPSSCAATAPLDRAPDSDLDSNSSFTHNRLCYDSEASCSTVVSYAAPPRKKNESILDILIQKYGRREEPRKKQREETKSKETTSGTVTGRREPETSASAAGGELQHLRTLCKETDCIKKSKSRMSIKEVFGDERPASAPPSSCRERDVSAPAAAALHAAYVERPTEVARPKPKKLCKERVRPKSSSIRDGLRSTSLKKCDAKGRLLRLKKRNNLLKSLGDKRPREGKKPVRRVACGDEESQGPSATRKVETGIVPTRKRLKRLFARRKLSSGFDYIRKKKKLLKRQEEQTQARRARPARRAHRRTPQSVHDVHQEIKGWFINKSVGETPLHRAARLGYTDCVAYCLEKLGAEASARDNAGFTPLHVAAARGHLPIARLLLQYGANVSAAAQGGIRPLHEASEGEHVEMIRLLLSFGADPLLATYAGQTPAALADSAGATAAADLLRHHVADLQGATVEPWIFPYPNIAEEESGCDTLASPPPASPPPPDFAVEIQSTDAPLPPFYSLKAPPATPGATQSALAAHAHDGLWCLLQDVTSLLQIKSRDSLLKQIHCGAGSPRELLRELRTSEFLERAQCHQLLGAGEKVNVRASKVALVRLTDKLRQLLRIETTVLS